MMHPHKHLDKPVGELSMRYMLDSRLKTTLTGLLEEEPAAAQSMFYFKPPGARGQDLHQDNYYLRVAPKTCCAMWLAIDDADEENGGMVVVPGSQNTPVLCPTPSDKTQFFTDHHVEVPEGLAPTPVNLKAGDVLFFNGSVIHGSYPNTSPDRFRRAFICHYLPHSSAEISHYYHCLDFDGNPIEYADSTMGGPCGGDWMEVKGPH
jgi:ectoine hydroxylase-related dioxygenase (phytanoyl-CoA dioxygenase family)